MTLIATRADADAFVAAEVLAALQSAPTSMPAQSADDADDIEAPEGVVGDEEDEEAPRWFDHLDIPSDGSSSGGESDIGSEEDDDGVL